MASMPHRRTRLVVDPGFQARYVAMVVGVALLIMAALGAMYLRVLAEERDLMGLATCAHAVADPSVEEFNAELRQEVARSDRPTILALAVAAAILTGVLATMSIRMSLRAAGPARAATGMLRRLAEGDLDWVRHFRRHDEFQFLDDALFEVREAKVREASADAELLERAAGACGDAALAGELARAAAGKRRIAGLTEPAT